MHKAQGEWALRWAPSPDPEDSDADNYVNLPGQAPDAATTPPHQPAPPQDDSATLTAAASVPLLLRILPIPDSPASPEPQSPAESLDETFLIVWADNLEALLLVSASPPRSLGRSFARSIPPRLPS